MATESKFRKDPHLAFLQDADPKDLKILATYLIKDSTGKEQWTGELGKTLAKQIKQYSTEDEVYRNSWMAIAAELQLFGGDTLVNFFRREGVLYEEILKDVADKLDVDFHKDIAEVEQIEEKIHRSLFGKVITLDELSLMNTVLKEKGLLGLSSLMDNPVETLKNSLFGGSISSIVAGTTARLLTRTNPMIGTPLVFKDITSPAYRVTIPAVCIVAMLRNKVKVYQDKSNLF